MKKMILFSLLVSLLSFGCATTGTTTGTQSSQSSDEITVHKLTDQSITKTINIPTVSASGQSLTDKEVLQSIFEIMKQHTQQPTFTRRNVSGNGGFVYNGMYAGMSKDEPGIFEIEYHGNTHIKPIGASRIGMMRVAVPYTISEGKVTLTLPTEFKEQNQRGFSLFPAKQLDTPENIRKDILHVFSSLESNQTICKSEDLEFVVKTEKKIDDIFAQLEKTFESGHCGNYDGRDYCKDLNYIFPNLRPELFKSCPSYMGFKVFDTHVQSEANMKFERYMAAHNATVSITVPYLISNGEVKGREAVEETKKYFTELLAN